MPVRHRIGFTTLTLFFLGVWGFHQRGDVYYKSSWNRFPGSRNPAKTGNRTPERVKMIESEDAERTLGCPLMLNFKSRQGFLGASPPNQLTIVRSPTLPTWKLVHTSSNLLPRTAGFTSQPPRGREQDPVQVFTVICVWVYCAFVFVFTVHLCLFEFTVHLCLFVSASF